MISVLYISYTGLLDPLGESQVLQYLRELGRVHRITLLTFEKPVHLADRARLAAMEAKCAEAGIAWHRRVWHKRPSLAATAWDVFQGSRQAIALAREAKADIVHCRSYVGSLIGLQVKRTVGARLVFDMRGFWADERAEAGRWNRSGPIYKAVKRIEKALFLNADYVVSLTRAGVRAFEQFDYLQGKVPPSSVIPTCTNLELFRPREVRKGPFTLGYIGSAGSWYVFDKVAEVAARILKADDQARFMIINKDDHDVIRRELLNSGMDLERVELRSCPYDEVGRYVSKMDGGLFFYLRDWSKCATSPTRMGEFLGCGVPCLTNDGIGDVSENLGLTGTGVVLPVDPEGVVDLSEADDAIDDFLALCRSPDISSKCRGTAKTLFSLESGVAEYDRIYRMLSPATDSNRASSSAGKFATSVTNP